MRQKLFRYTFKNRSYSTVKIEVRELSATNAVQLYLLGLLFPPNIGVICQSVHIMILFTVPLYLPCFLPSPERHGKWRFDFTYNYYCVIYGRTFVHQPMLFGFPRHQASQLYNELFDTIIRQRNGTCIKQDAGGIHALRIGKSSYSYQVLPCCWYFSRIKGAQSQTTEI